MPSFKVMDMSDINTEVTPSFHPDSFREVDGYNEDTAGYVAGTINAFDMAYRMLGEVHAAREAAKNNPEWTEARQVLKVAELASKAQDKLARSFDAASANLQKGIVHLEGELTRPLETQAGLGVVPSEIRAHVKQMDLPERQKFLRVALENGDDKSLVAVLGAPGYLSGLNSDLQDSYIRMYREMRYPDVAARLKVMKGVQALADQRMGLLFKETEKALGASFEKVKRLKAASTKAAQAFILSDLA